MQFVPSTEWASAVGIEKSGAGLIDAPRLLCSCTTRAQTHGRRRSSCAQAPLKGWTGVITRFRVNCRNDRYIFYNGHRALQPRTRYQIDILTHVLSRHTDAHKTMS